MVTDRPQGHLPLTLSESGLQRVVIDYAKLRGFMVCHFRAALNRAGSWSTPIEGDPGFPDLVMSRDGTVLHVELKRQNGRLTPMQKKWGVALGESYRCWRTSDWNDGTIYQELR